MAKKPAPLGLPDLSQYAPGAGEMPPPPPPAKMKPRPKRRGKSSKKVK